MRVVFCSCCKIQQINPQPIWSDIQARKPDVLLLLGDNIYLDHDSHDDPKALQTELQTCYARQLRETNFAALLVDLKARAARVLAIYDDHDFLGNNRYGGDNPPSMREAARSALSDAFSPPRTGDDIYSASTFGNVLILMLDTRFYRRRPADSATSRDAVLGESQWTWLEQQLAAPTPAFVILASGSTFHRFDNESWEQYPTAFERLRSLLGHRKGTMFLSGDIHSNEAYDDSGVLELASSGVARRGIVFGGKRANYGVLDFDATGVDVEFVSRKKSNRAKFRVSLDDWSLTD